MTFVPRHVGLQGKACGRSSTASTQCCVAGSLTSGTATARRSALSTDGYAAGCEACCATTAEDGASPGVTTIIAGPTPSLPRMGSSACNEPMPWPASPLAGKTTNWRAGCGRSARPVRREGEASASPYPYRKTLKPQRRKIGRAAVEVRRVLEGFAQPEHVAFGEGLADDLDAERQAARLTGGHGEAAQAEIVGRSREIARDRRALVDLGERDRRHRHGRQQDRIVGLHPIGEDAP